MIARIGDRRDAFDVEEGDYLLSSGDDLYLALNREGRDANGRPVPPPEAEREDAAAKTARAKSTSKPRKKTASKKSSGKRTTGGKKGGSSRGKGA